jgi:hypothetical protein
LWTVVNYPHGEFGQLDFEVQASPELYLVEHFHFSDWLRISHLVEVLRVINGTIGGHIIELDCHEGFAYERVNILVGDLGQVAEH